jgi:hypothetical protein
MYPNDTQLGTMPQWLHQRYGHLMPEQMATWDDLSPEDQSYWRHEAKAALRAVVRGGYKAP